MVNYACAFSQSELGKYFIHIVLLFYHCRSHLGSRASFCLLLDQAGEKEVLPESYQAFESLHPELLD